MRPEVSVLLDTSMLEMLASLASPGEPSPVLEILEVYRDDGTQVLAALQQATSDGDLEQVRRTAHRLKGSSANMGAVALVEVLGRVEEDALGGITPRLEADVLRAQQLFLESLAGIEAYAF